MVVDNRLSAGIESLLQAHGIGGMRPNTVLLGFPGSADRWDEFCASLRLIDRYQRNIVLVDYPENNDRWSVQDGSIDVLWQGSEHGELMVLLGYLLKQSAEWRANPLRVLAGMPPKGDADKLRASLDLLLRDARVDASVHVYSSEDIYITLARRTGHSAALILQFDPPEPEQQAEFFEWTQRLAKLVPDIIYVHSARGISLHA